MLAYWIKWNAAENGGMKYDPGPCDSTANGSESSKDAGGIAGTAPKLRHNSNLQVGEEKANPPIGTS